MKSRSHPCFSAFSALLVASMPFSATAADCMSSEPEAWLTSTAQKALYSRLGAYLSCPDDLTDGPLADQGACNYLVGRVVNDVYGFGDFRRPSGGWLAANEIAAYVKREESKWELIGQASSQQALEQAAAAAGEGRAVIAVATGSPGHVALVLPGPLKFSSSWNRNVPNSASFFLGNVDRAYVFCKLSWAFSSADSVRLYRRN